MAFCCTRKAAPSINAAYKSSRLKSLFLTMCASALTAIFYKPILLLGRTTDFMKIDKFKEILVMN